MGKNKLPKGARKHIRLEKARIRRQVFDFKKRNEMIKELIHKTLDFNR